MELVTIRDGPRLVPATPFDLEELEKVRQRQQLRTTVTFLRSGKHWRWFNGLVAVVAEGLGMHRDALYVALKAKAGFIKSSTWIPRIGRVIETQSFAFTAADEIKFTEFRVLAVELLFSDYLPGVKRSDVWERVEGIMGEPCPW